MVRPFILAADLAIQSGFADGSPDKPPRFWSWDLRKAGEGRPQRLGLFAELLDVYLNENPVTHLYYEAPLSMTAAAQIGVNEHTFAFLRGIAGVAEAMAARRGVQVIQAISVTSARAHFCRGKIPKGEGKRTVMRMCRTLGWNPQNENESDSAAIWSYGCATSNPRLAHLTSPLFGSVKPC